MKIEYLKLFKFKNLITTSIMLLGVLSCQSNISSLEDYSKYIANPSNGFCKESSTNLLQLEVKYLPESYWAMKEKQQNSVNSFNEICKNYQNFLTFQVIIKPKEDSKKNLKEIIHRSVLHEKDYTEQITILNYRMANFFKININEQILKPLDVKLEDNSFDKQVSFIVTFSRPIKVEMSPKISFLVEENFFLDKTSKVEFLSKEIFVKPTMNIKQ